MRRFRLRPPLGHRSRAEKEQQRTRRSAGVACSGQAEPYGTIVETGPGARTLCLIAAVLLVAISAKPAAAGGGNYAFDGGTRAERAQVRAALAASLFDWSLVPELITIRIGAGVGCSARAGTIELDSGLLQTGRFAWGVIQHEYAHQVDFFLLDDAMRARLAERLGGESWWQTSAGVPHQALTSERFASSLAWAYWPSPDNVLRPTSAADEAGALAPADFRLLLGDVLGVSVPSRRVVASARRR